MNINILQHKSEIMNCVHNEDYATCNWKVVMRRHGSSARVSERWSHSESFIGDRVQVAGGGSARAPGHLK